MGIEAIFRTYGITLELTDALGYCFADREIILQAAVARTEARDGFPLPVPTPLLKGPAKSLEAP